MFVFVTVLAIGLYLGAAAAQFSHAWRNPEKITGGSSAFSGCSAATLHILILHHYTEQFGGLEILFAISACACLAVCILLIYSVFRPRVERLLLLFYPLAAITLTVLVSSFETTDLSGNESRLTLHALFSLGIFAVLGIASVQTLYLLFLHSRLKKHRISRLERLLPALETQESMLSEMLGLGILLLGTVIFSGIWNGMELHILPGILSALALLTLCIMLLGRHLLGWRGMNAGIWALGSFTLLTLAWLGH